MADVINQYNHTFSFITKTGMDNIVPVAMLLNSSGTFDATDTTLDDVAGAPTGSPAHRPNEVYGNGWAEDGEALDTVAVSVWNTTGFMIDGADERHTATGGAIGPYNAVVVYDLTTGKPLWHINNGGTLAAKTAGEATDNVIVWNAAGILRGSL